MLMSTVQAEFAAPLESGSAPATAHANRDASADLRSTARRLGARLRFVSHAAVLEFDRPPPSTWSVQQRAGFIELIAAVAERPGLASIVLHGSRLFVETYAERTPKADAAFHDVLAAIAGCRVPVTAAIVGDAIGAGLELALACAQRVAGPRSSFCLPAVHAGRMPVNGAIEQLPRLIGVDAAARMLVFGAWVGAQEARDLGLVDQIEGDNLVSAAIARRAAAPAAEPPCRTQPPADAAGALSRAFVQLRQQAPGQTTPLAVLKAMESAQCLPLRRSLAETLKLNAALVQTDQARALAYAETGVAVLRAAIADDAFDIADLLARLRWPFLRETIHLIDEGATPAQVDRVVVRYGLPDGPFSRSDRFGLAMLYPRDQRWLAYSPTLDLMADAHRDGGPNAPGWFRRGGGGCEAGAALPMDPEVEHLLRGSATFQRLTRKPMTDEVVLERCLHAAINGAATLVEEIGVQHAPLVDALCVALTGFPRWKGGPLYQADRIGLEAVAATLKKLHAARNTAGLPSPLLTSGRPITG